VRLAEAQGTTVTAWVDEMLRGRLAGAGIVVEPEAEPVRVAPQPAAVLARFGEFTRLRGSGVPLADAASRMGVSLKTARKYESWIGQAPERGGKPAAVGPAGGSGSKVPVAASAAHGVPQPVFAAPPEGGQE
jgi:hypothetical protein